MCAEHCNLLTSAVTGMSVRIALLSAAHINLITYDASGMQIDSTKYLIFDSGSDSSRFRIAWFAILEVIFIFVCECVCE